MNPNFVRVPLVAAAVVLIAVVGFQFLGNSDTGGPDGTETPQPTARTSVVPTSEPVSDLELPGSPLLLWDGRPDGVSITVTLPDNSWMPIGQGWLSHDNDPNARVYGSVEEYYVYGDSCHWRTTMPVTPATAVEEVVAALQSQTSGREHDHELAGEWVSDPMDISVDGYSGKSITLHAPTIFPVGCDLDQWAYFASEDYVPHRFLISGGPYEKQGLIDELWIVDVDGAVVVFDIELGGGEDRTQAEEDRTQAELDELRDILASATFD